MSVPVPSLNWLRVFEAAARCESFARAASELNMSPAAVSQQVRALEDRVGVPLFVRHAHAVTLTDTGRAYLPGVQQALATLQTATDGLFGAGQEQLLYVQSVLLFAQGVLAPHYSDFVEAHPDIALMLTTTLDSFEAAPGYFEMKIVFGNARSHGETSDVLLEETLYPVARPDIAASIQSGRDLLSHRLIEVSTHRAGWAYVFDEYHIPPGQARYCYADSTVMAMTLAAEGVGVALARAPASDLLQRHTGLVPCGGEIRLPGREAYHLVYPEGGTLRAPARRFRDWLLALCARM